MPNSYDIQDFENILLFFPMIFEMGIFIIYFSNLT